MPRKRLPPTCMVRIRKEDLPRLRAMANRAGLSMPQLMHRMLRRTKNAKI